MKTWMAVGFLLLLVLVFFRGWFVPNPLSSGDWGYFYPDVVRDFPIVPQAWDTQYGGGLGGNDVFLLPLNTYFYSTSMLLQRFLGADWVFIERAVWYVPVVFFLILSSFVFSRHFVQKWPFPIIASLVYATNTYILMLLGGGQVGVAMGYAMLPWVLWAFMAMWDARDRHQLFYRCVRAGLLLAAQILFDPRLAYIALVGLGILYVVHACGSSMRYRFREFTGMAVAGMIAVVLHLFWLVPFVMIGTNPLKTLGDEFVNIGMVKYLSFAPFEHTLSLLHPNWPENVFGKIRFLQPEFLIVPLIAYAALLFVPRIVSRVIRNRLLGVALIGIIGAFLSKGANPPFGGIYIWMFEHIPGFVMLRDSSKFYVLTALAYSVLIPVTLAYVSDIAGKVLRSPYGKRATGITFVLFICIWAGLSREAVFGKLTGTFAPVPIPQEYIRLSEHLVSGTSYSRVLWVPTRQRFGYVSPIHPALTVKELQNASAAAVGAWFSDYKNRDILARAGVSHVVVPTDPKGELFVTDRTYDDGKRRRVVSILDYVGTHNRLTGFGEIAVYKTQYHHGLVFWEDDPNVKLTLLNQTATGADVTLPPQTQRRRLVFSQSFDPFWRLVLPGGDLIRPEQTPDGLQAYELPSSSRTMVVQLRYSLQPSVLFYAMFSLGAGLLAIAYVIHFRQKKRI